MQRKNGSISKAHFQMKRKLLMKMEILMKKLLLIFILCFSSVTGLNFLLHGEEYCSSCSEITSGIASKMTHSWNDNNPVPLKDLRYITVKHWGFDHKVHAGELIVHKDVAIELTEIFDELFQAHYPIQKVCLIDEYQGSDDLSMEDNNSSAFCSRMITGSSAMISNHSYGRAIDINPFQNPYVKEGLVLPKGAKLYIDRGVQHPGMIKENDPCYNAFVSRGWLWGGDWKTLSNATPEKKDYQHFAKPEKS